MATATRTRKPLVHTCRLDGSLLGITLGKKAYVYRVEPLDADFGLGVRLRKYEAEHEGAPLVETEVYDLNLDGRRSTCECPGFLRWSNPCKHLRALVALQDAGKLLPALDAIRAENARLALPTALPALLARVQAALAA